MDGEDVAGDCKLKFIDLVLEYQLNPFCFSDCSSGNYPCSAVSRKEVNEQPEEFEIRQTLCVHKPCNTFNMNGTPKPQYIADQENEMW